MPNTPPPKGRAPTAPIDAPAKKSAIVKIPPGPITGQGVPNVTIEDPTPVDMPMDALLERRTRQTKEQVDTTHATVTKVQSQLEAAHRDVNLARTELRHYVAQDQAEHRMLFAGLSSIEKRQDDLGVDLKTMDSKVDELAKSAANVHGKLDILIGTVQSQQRIVEHREKITIEREATEEKLMLEDKVDEKKFTRQKWLKIFGILGGAVTILTTAIAALLGKCG